MLKMQAPIKQALPTCCPASSGKGWGVRHHEAMSKNGHAGLFRETMAAVAAKAYGWTGCAVHFMRGKQEHARVGAFLPQDFPWLDPHTFGGFGEAMETV